MTAKATQFDAKRVNSLVQTFKLLSDATRLRIVILVSAAGEGGMCVNDICRAIGQGQPAISHHLALMRVSGLLMATRDARHVFYSIAPGAFDDVTGFLGAA